MGGAPTRPSSRQGAAGGRSPPNLRFAQAGETSTDSLHCGGCGNQCNGTCSGGTCEAGGCGGLNLTPFDCDFAWGANGNSGNRSSYLDFISTWVGFEYTQGREGDCDGCRLVSDAAGAHSSHRGTGFRSRAPHRWLSGNSGECGIRAESRRTADRELTECARRRLSAGNPHGTVHVSAGCGRGRRAADQATIRARRLARW